MNLIARPAARAVDVALFAHIDTERAGAGWTSLPHAPRCAAGRLYGLGAADDKAGVAAAAVAAAALVDAGGPCPIVLSVHSKGGGARGAAAVFASLNRLDAALYLHPAETGNGLSEVKHVSRGLVDVTLVVDGWRGREREPGRADTAPFDEGGNALEACLSAVRRWRAGALRRCEINTGRVTAGDAAGTVAAHCEAEIRIIFDEPLSLRDVLAAMADDLAEAARAAGSPAHVFRAQIARSGASADPARLSWDHPWCRTVAASVEAIAGAKPGPYENQLASDIRFPMRLLNAPAVGIGPLAGNFYQADEWVDLDGLTTLVAIAMRSVWTWCEESQR